MSTQTNNSDYGRFDFVGKTTLFTIISIALTVISVVYLAVHGINYGIDFRGGTEFQVRFSQPVAIDTVRGAIDKLNLGEVGVQAVGEDNEFIIRFQGRDGKTDKETNEILNDDIGKIRNVIATEFAAQGPEVRRVDTVGPQVGAELKRNGLLAFFYSLLVILIYVGLRFDYKFGPGTIFCLAHDAIITLAIYVAVGKEVNIPILAAILSLITYSLNDTIVVFDRIRETENRFHDRGFSFVINKALNDTLGRTLITSGTTFVCAMSLYLFGGGTVSDIAFALAVGIAFGTYSSIYVAAPTVLWIDKMKAKKA